MPRPALGASRGVATREKWGAREEECRAIRKRGNGGADAARKRAGSRNA